MKHRVLGIVLGLEGAVCVLFGILQTSFSQGFTAAMAFPFEQLGALLRMLSLSGRVGNAAALVWCPFCSCFSCGGNGSCMVRMDFWSF